LWALERWNWFRLRKTSFPEGRKNLKRPICALAEDCPRLEQRTRVEGLEPDSLLPERTLHYRVTSCHGGLVPPVTEDGIGTRFGE